MRAHTRARCAHAHTAAPHARTRTFANAATRLPHCGSGRWSAVCSSLLRCCLLRLGAGFLPACLHACLPCRHCLLPLPAAWVCCCLHCWFTALPFKALYPRCLAFFFFLRPPALHPLPRAAFPYPALPASSTCATLPAMPPTPLPHLLHTCHTGRGGRGATYAAHTHNPTGLLYHDADVHYPRLYSAFAAWRRTPSPATLYYHTHRAMQHAPHAVRLRRN